MSLFALIVDEAVAETEEKASNFNADEVRHKFDWRPVVDDPDPALLASETYDGYDFVVEPTLVVRTRHVRVKTTRELDDDARSAALMDAWEAMAGVDLTKPLNDEDVLTLFTYIQLRDPL